MSQKSGFERIFTFAIDRCPQLAPKNTHAIREWLANGYDVEGDIIPAIDRATKQGGRSIQSFNYFTGSIHSMNERRVKAVTAPVALTDEQRDQRRAATINIRQRSGMYVTDAERQWLQKYEEGVGRNA